MRRSVVLVVAIVAVTGIMGAFATTASAHPGVSYPTRCSNCHNGTGTNPTATLVSNNGTTATYNVSGGALEWALFNGTTRLAGQVGSVGQFSVAVGGTYTLYSVDGYPGPLGVTTVHPVAPVAQFTIMASAGPNGSIAPGSVTVNSGANVAYTITAAPGFHIADVLVDGISVGSGGTYTFSNVTADHTIAASFDMNTVLTYTISPTSGDHGSILPGTAQTVVAGSDAPFMIVASPGYHVADVLIDGLSVGAVGSYTFTNVQEDHTISASFELNVVGQFTITPSAGANGSISPSDVQTVNSGDSVAFTITPDAGYHIETVMIDGAVIPTPASGIYVFTNVTANHTITAAFSNDPDVAAPTVCTLRSNHSSVRDDHFIGLSSVIHNTLPALFFGTQIRYEVRRPGSTKWVLLTTRMADTAGTTSVATKLTRRGLYRYRVRFLGSDDFAPSTSRTVTVRCR